MTVVRWRRPVGYAHAPQRVVPVSQLVPRWWMWDAEDWKLARRYARHMRRGDVFPMITVVHNVRPHDPCDGTHRLIACKMLGVTHVPVVLCKDRVCGYGRKKGTF